MNKKYTWAYLLIAFFMFAIGWIVWRTPYSPPAASASSGEALAANMDESEFEPDASNVSPSTHTQLESLRKRVVEAPEDTTHIFRLGRMLQDAHKPEEAARNYRHYLALHPENYQAWLDMTQSFGQAEMWDEALESVQDMLERYPDDPSAQYNLGAIYANLARTDEARAIWERLIEADPDPEITLLSQHSLSRLPSR